MALGRMEDLVPAWVTCSETRAAGAQLELQALTFALEFKQRSLYWLHWQGSTRDTAGCVLLLPSSCPSVSLLQGGIWRQGTLFTVLCVRCQPGAVNTAWFCSEKVQSYHWWHFSSEARAGNLLAWRAGLLGAAAVGGKPLCGAHVINKLKGSSTVASLS